MQILQAKKFIITEEKDDNILKIQFLPNTEIYQEMVTDVLSEIALYTKKQKVKLLYDAREVVYYEKGVCKTYSKQSQELISSMAILLDTLASRIMINHFIKNCSTTYAVKIFRDDSEAKNWLKYERS